MTLNCLACVRLLLGEQKQLMSNVAWEGDGAGGGRKGVLSHILCLIFKLRTMQMHCLFIENAKNYFLNKNRVFQQK